MFILGAFLVLSGHGIAYAFPQGDKDCSKCHTLTNEQAKTVMENLIPDVKIIDVQPGPITVSGRLAWSVSGNKAIIYLDYSKKILSLGSGRTKGKFVDIKTRTNLTEDESFNTSAKIDYSAIPLERFIGHG